MDWSTDIEYLPSVLKEFDGVTAPTDKLFIWYFWDDLKLSIWAQLLKKDCNLDYQQAVLEQAIDVKAKVACQAPSLACKGDACCAKDHRLLKSEKSKDQKEFQAKKNHNPPVDNNNSRGRNRGQSSQALNWSSKKDFGLNREGQQSQSSNISATSNNAITVKKNKKQGGEKNLSQVECYSCDKKCHYSNKYPDKESKNQYQSWQPLHQ